MTAVSTSQPVPPAKASQVANSRPVLLVIAVLLLLLLAVNVFQLARTLQHYSQRAERAQQAERIVQTQQTIIANLMDEYQQAAYENPNVETIYQQQLIASEHILQALHIVAIQNSQVIELLAVSP